MQRIYDDDLPSERLRCKQLSDDPIIQFHQLNDLQFGGSTSDFESQRAATYFEKCVRSNREHDRIHKKSKPSGNKQEPKFSFHPTADSYIPSKDLTKPNVCSKYPTPISHRYQLYLQRLRINVPECVLDKTHLKDYLEYCHKHNYEPFSFSSFEGKVLKNHTYDENTGLWREIVLREITANELRCIRVFLELRKQYFETIIGVLRTANLYELERFDSRLAPEMEVTYDEFLESITVQDGDTILSFVEGVFHHFDPEYPDFYTSDDEDAGFRLDFDLPKESSKTWVSSLELSNKGFNRLYSLLHRIAIPAGLLLSSRQFRRVRERGRLFIAQLDQLMLRTLKERGIRNLCNQRKM